MGPAPATRPTLMTDPTTQFAEAAAAFCAWCESAPGEDENAEAALAVGHLSKLYLFATDLAAPEDFDEDIDGEGSDDATWDAVFKRCAAFPFSLYGEVFHPHVVPSEEPVIGDLGHDIADIHRDLIGGVGLYRAGHVAEAQIDWRMGFEMHWGRHAISALRALHCWQASSGWWGGASD